MATPLEGAPPGAEPDVTGAPAGGEPAGSPGGPPVEPQPGPPAGLAAPGAPAGQPGEQPPGTETVEPTEIEIPKDFDHLSFLQSRLEGAEPTLDAAAGELYRQRVEFGRQGSRMGTLERQNRDQQQTIVTLQRQVAAGEGGGGEGDIYESAVRSTEQALGPRPDPEENAEAARRWDVTLNSQSTHLTMERYQSSALADFQGQQAAETFLTSVVPPELQAEFSYSVNSLLGDGYPRSNISWELLSTLYQGLMYNQAVENAWRSGTKARADQIVAAQLGGLPIHTGPGGGPPPPGAVEGYTYETLMVAAKAPGGMDPKQFGRVLTELKRQGKAPLQAPPMDVPPGAAPL